MEHEEIYLLMMEALDGDLADSDYREMEAHLAVCHSCEREWQAVQTIHQLFLQAPVLSPAADFTQRTLAGLPNNSYRIWLIGIIYGFLLVSGVLPLVVIGWVVTTLAPALIEPVFGRGLVQAGSQVGALISAVVGASWQGLGGLVQLLADQPNILGWLFVMVGVVFLWGSVYRQMTTASSRA
ncbi:MAG: zf-HC2 domain-containing protein [Candidatus Promineifilaceae bacterium]